MNPTSTSSSTLKPKKLLRLFSRPGSHTKDEMAAIEPTSNSEGSCRSFPEPSILKYKTQEQSLAKPYPKPFICPQCNPKKKHVQFSTVSTRCYPTILSDHPSTLEGPAVGLDWTVVNEYTLPLRPDGGGGDSKTTPCDFLLCKWARERRLLNRGYTKAQLKQAEREAQRIRASRTRNAQPYPSCLYPLARWVSAVPYVEDRGKGTVFPKKKTATTTTTTTKKPIAHQPGKKLQHRPL